MNCEIIKINKTNYYKVDEIIVEYSYFNKGCKTIADIISKHKLKRDEDYIYAKLIEKKWTKTNGTSKKFDKLFATEDWLDTKKLKKKSWKCVMKN
jgi:hypothetical protein